MPIESRIILVVEVTNSSIQSNLCKREKSFSTLEHQLFASQQGWVSLFKHIANRFLLMGGIKWLLSAYSILESETTACHLEAG